MNQQKLSLCPICDGDLIQEIKSVEAEYKAVLFYYSQTGLWCTKCGEGFLSPKDLDYSKKQITDNKRIIDHRLIAEDIKTFRKINKLSQREASKLFGGGPNAFSKYERGEIIQSKSTDVLMRLVSSKKITIDDIREIEQSIYH
ncbi:MAG: type II toxin-antitoxin system MqsA family antitoxin [Spirochaetaceae bacterium]|jgi:HTH-type transcriptional regulator/antitoxin MqsA|nr:type II toxin-antitoxin system MqsA family antitoxin [Spirochaetaceae bacterium]